MTYEFKCPKCNKHYDLVIPMVDYDKQKDSQYCVNCNEKMERVYTPSMIGLCDGMYGIDSGNGSWNS